MGRFTIADLYNMMADRLALTQRRDFDIFARTEWILSHDSRQVDLLEFLTILQKEVRYGRTCRKQEQSNQGRKVAVTAS
jgi:hypothetical protein